MPLRVDPYRRWALGQAIEVKHGKKLSIREVLTVSSIEVFGVENEGTLAIPSFEEVCQL